MSARSDAVVIGTVRRVAGTGTVHMDLPTAAPDPQTPWTEFDVDLTRALKGRPAATIVVRQTGGQLPDGSSFALADDPMLVPGDSVVLFLREFAPNHYAVLAGPTGRLGLDGTGHITALPGSSLQTVPSTLTQLETAVG